LNTTPIESFNNSSDQMLYNNGAYDSERYSIKNKKSFDKYNKIISKSFAEESKALGGVALGQGYKGSVPGSFIRMRDVPEYVCEVICAGIQPDNLYEGMYKHHKEPKNT